MTPFSRLSRSTLLAVADALDSGRLSSGSALAVATYVPPMDAEEIGAEIGGLLEGGARPEHVAYLLRAIADERARSETAAATVELVWSGPDGSGDGARDTGVVVRELFATARKSVLVAGFAVHQGKEIFLSLAEQMDARPELSVVMLLNIPRGYRDTTLESQLVRRFSSDFKTKQWPGVRLPKIYYDPRSLSMDERSRVSLHAKCVVVDDERVFITSANFTEAGQQRNIEVGVVIHSEPVAGSAAKQFRRLIERRNVRELQI